MRAGNFEQDLGGAAGFAGPLLPVVQLAEADAQQVGKLGLRMAQLSARGGDRRLPVCLLTLLEGPWIYRTTNASALSIHHVLPDLNSRWKEKNARKRRGERQVRRGEGETAYPEAVNARGVSAEGASRTGGIAFPNFW